VRGRDDADLGDTFANVNAGNPLALAAFDFTPSR